MIGFLILHRAVFGERKTLIVGKPQPRLRNVQKHGALLRRTRRQSELCAFLGALPEVGDFGCVHRLSRLLSRKINQCDKSLDRRKMRGQQKYFSITV
jgi:hypothetical protein